MTFILKAKNKSQFKEIWDNLYNIDVSEHIEKKMNLDFLSWGKAYTLMLSLIHISEPTRPY
mgnify:CR=1 FL=1